MNGPSPASRLPVLALIVAWLVVWTSPAWAATANATCPMDAGGCNAAVALGSCCCIQGAPASTTWPDAASGSPDAAREEVLGPSISHATLVDTKVAVRLGAAAAPRTRSHQVSRDVLRI